MYRVIRPLFCVLAAALLSTPALAQSTEAESEAALAEINAFLERTGPDEPPSEEYEAELKALRSIAREFAVEHIAEQKAFLEQQEIEWPNDDFDDFSETYGFPTHCEVEYPETSITHETDTSPDVLWFTRPLIDQEIVRIDLVEKGFPESIVTRALKAYEDAWIAYGLSRYPYEEFEENLNEFAKDELFPRGEVIAILYGWRLLFPDFELATQDPESFYILGFDLPVVAAGLILNDYRDKHDPSLPKIVRVSGECGAGDYPVTISLEPPEGWGAVIPSFNLKFCQVAGKDLEALGECQGWVRFEPGDKVFLSQGGDYFMVGRWPDGKRTDIPVRVNDDTVTLKPE